MYKTLFFAIFLFLLTEAFSVRAKDIASSQPAKKIAEFEKELNACTKAYAETGKNTYSTADMSNAAYAAASCYIDIGNKIIDAFYTQSSVQNKNNLSNLLTAMYTVNSDIMQSADYCMPSCGSSVSVAYKAKTAEDIKNIVKRYIDNLKIHYAK